jgi:hypothetical protein
MTSRELDNLVRIGERPPWLDLVSLDDDHAVTRGRPWQNSLR